MNSQHKLIELARVLEWHARPYGYHVGVTGSALYGRMDGKGAEDLDILIYWHSSDAPLMSAWDLLTKVFQYYVQDCNKYE